MRCSDGSIRKMISRAYPVRDRQNNVVECILANTDVTRLKSGEEFLLQEQVRLEQLVQQRTADLTRANEHLLREIEDRKMAEEALTESEARVRLKLDSILSPEGDIETLELADVIDTGEIQMLMDDFYGVTNIGVAILDLKGEVLVATGWQDICTKFHRVHPEARQNCIESDTQLSNGVAGGDFKLYHCLNHMWDIATPIMVGGNHFGNLFLGQFLFEDEEPAQEIFRTQAREYGFDEETYISALERVPRWSRETVDLVMGFYAKMTNILSRLSFSNIKLARSISERERLLHSLRESEAQLSNAMIMAHLGPWEYDVTKDLFTFNDNFYKIFRTTVEQVGGYTMSSADYARRFVHPDDLVVVSDETRKAIETTDPNFSRQLDHRILYADGEVGHISVRFFVVKDDLGRTVKTYGVNQDITERKRTEQSLRRSEELLRTVIGAAPVGITLSVGRNLVWVNDAWNMIFGLGQEGAGEGSTSARTMYPTQEEFERVGKLLYEGLETGRIGESDATMIRKDGTIFDAHIAMKAVDPSDFNKGSIGIIMDMTARKEAEQERESLRNQLFQSQKMEAIGTLTGGIAHDFNNLLTIMNGYTEMILSEKGREDPLYEDLQKILQTGRKGAELVQRLLALSRKGESDPQPLDLNHTVENMGAFMTRTFSKTIEIVTVLGKDLGTVNADPNQVEQVLMNLCINSKEAMPDGGRITIETGITILDEEYCILHPGVRPGPYAVIEVRDTGVGVDEETMARIFDPFFTTKGWDFQKGTGLGLSVAKGIVEQHGGWITCDSERGKGTTFRLYFPIIEESTEDPKTHSLAETVSGGDKILLVDDEELVRDLGKRILERAGYTVITASNGKTALEIYPREQSNIGLVVLDLIMPQMGGEKCLERLLKLNPQVKVVVSSGHSLSPKERDLLRAHAKGFVDKPYQIKQFLEVVRGVLVAE